MLENLLDRIGDWNPQLLREIKGRLNPRNLIIVSSLSLIGQFFLHLLYQAQLPEKTGTYNRYCIGTPPQGTESYNYSSYNYCVENLAGQLTLNWQLWWFDIFTVLSFISFFVLLVGGVYMLVNDLTIEENRGTLNFIRLTPQTAKNILIGKILGVPSLIYFLAGLALPLHFYAGLSAHIPLGFLLLFYITLITACGLFYSVSLLYSLVSASLVGFKTWLISGAVLMYLWIMNAVIMGYSIASNTPFDWFIVFYPGTILLYLSQATELNPSVIGHLDPNNLNQLSWYNQTLWTNAFSGIALMLLNYGVCTYFVTRCLQRRFHNPITPPLSKIHSYALTACYTIVFLGFVMHFNNPNNYRPDFEDNLTMFQVFSVGYFLALIAGLSPHREVLNDWARYRHQQKPELHALWKDLLLGDRSPSSLALVVNLFICLMITVPTILVFNDGMNSLQLIAGIVLGLTTILIYGVLAQWLLLAKNAKRSVIAIAVISGIIIFPILALGILRMEPTSDYLPWLLTFVPLAAIKDAVFPAILMTFVAQVLMVSVITGQMTRQLKKAGESQTHNALNTTSKQLSSNL